MFANLRQYLPSRLFFLSNLLFWLILNTLSADNTYRQMLEYSIQRDVSFYDIWIDFLPFWMNWALATPLTIALVRKYSSSDLPTSRVVFNNIVIMVAAMCLYWSLTVIETAFMHSRGGISIEAITSAFKKLLLSPLHFDVLVYLTVACLALSMNYYINSKEQALTNQKLNNQLLKVELQSLKSQLSPHFLFNTLNTISGLVRFEKKTEAIKALSELSKMFRKVLENQQQQLTSLRDEIAFINSYLTIQKLRFEDKLAVDIYIQPIEAEVKVPFMLLHTLVENAVQHGSQLESDENRITLEVRFIEEKVHIQLTNKASTLDSHKGFGIGLDNCKKRLRHLYAGDYQFESYQRDDGYYQTDLILPTGEANV